jgi:hypothetical protein
MNMSVETVYLPGEFEKITKNIINPSVEKYYETGILPYIQYEAQQYHRDGTLL